MKKETKLNPFVYIRGVEERGREIIAELEKRGAVNLNKFSGDSPNSCYYINAGGGISIVAKHQYQWIKEHYEKIALVYIPKDKELVWCWDDGDLFQRSLMFFDSKNYKTFCFGDGMRNGAYYDNYAPYEGEWPEWAKEARKKLED